MDLQKLVDCIYTPACIVSVEKKTDGGYGDIRLVAGNKKYTEMAILRKGLDEFSSEFVSSVFLISTVFSSTDFFAIPLFVVLFLSTGYCSVKSLISFCCLISFAFFFYK